MAIIYTYGFDDNVQDKDAWVGTNSGNRKTKQFSALSVANYMNRYGRISIGGQMSYKLVASSPGLGEMSVIGGGDGTSFADIEFLNISTHDLSGAQVVEFLDYLTSTGILISRQNEPSVFGHYTVVAYTATIDPNVYKLELGILGSNGVVNTNMYYDLSPLNLAGGSGSGVNTIDTSEGSFITLTPTTPTAGNVLITADLSATGTPNATTFLRGDNTWAAAGEVDGNGTTNYVSKWADPSTLTDSVIYDDGTNVGIGTTSPDSLLEISTTDTTKNFIKLTSGGGSVNPTLVFEKSAAEQGVIQYIRNGDLKIYNTDNDGGVMFSGSSATNYDMYINHSGNVGIGTTSPIAKMHIFNGGYPQLNLQSNAGSWQVGVSAGNDFVIRKGSTGSVYPLWIDSNENVGIGTTSPSEKLEVVGDIAIRDTIGALNFIYSSTPTRIARLDSDNGNLRIKADINSAQANSFISFELDESEKMRITSTGNVGIGTTSPGANLEIRKSASDQVGPVLRLRADDSNDGDPEIQLYRGTGSAVGSSIRLNNSNTDLYFDNYYSGSATYGGIFFRTQVTGTPVDALTIMPEGNVGIGTTSPSDKLVVSGDQQGITINQSVAGNVFNGLDFTNFNGASNAYIKLNQNTGEFRIQTGPTYFPTFYASGSEAMRIDSSGNVGIGTTSPDYNLQVESSGNAEIQAQRVSGAGVLIQAQASTGVVGTNTNHRLDLKTNGGTRATILPNGNVGIGTTSPSEKLHVFGGAAAIEIDSTTNEASLKYDNSTTTASIKLANNDLKTELGGAERMRILANGNVGIGTTSPATKLHVSGGGGVSTPVLFTLGSNDDGTGANAAEIRLLDNGTTKWQVGKTSLNDFWVYDNTAGRSVITARDNGNLLLMQTSGNVGIGTSGPTQELHVDGNARVTGAFYDSNNSAGAVGQVLTSTSTSTEWTDPGSMTQVPVPITAFAGGSLALAATTNFVYFSWLGGSGTYTLNLPSAVTYPYKVIRFVTDGGTSASNKIHVQGSLGQTVDGGTFYELNKAYNGVQVWSDGTQWIVIQAKAT